MVSSISLNEDTVTLSDSCMFSSRFMDVNLNSNVLLDSKMTRLFFKKLGCYMSMFLKGYVSRNELFCWLVLQVVCDQIQCRTCIL